MNNTSDAADARPVTIAFVNCFDAATFGRTVHLTADEERRLRNVLAALRDYGFILEASFWRRCAERMPTSRPCAKHGRGESLTSLAAAPRRSRPNAGRC
jgi:hypothetical protein